MIISAGVLCYRIRAGTVEVLLAHPGGPFWRNRDEGAWSIPKGELDGSEDPETAARREFREETGFEAPDQLFPLGSVIQAGGKKVLAWSGESDLNPADFASNTFVMEWPPRSGVTHEFPEIDRLEWLEVAEARQKINPAQVAFLERLAGGLQDS